MTLGDLTNNLNTLCKMEAYQIKEFFDALQRLETSESKQLPELTVFQLNATLRSFLRNKHQYFC